MLRPYEVELATLGNKVRVEFLRGDYVGLIESVNCGEGGEEQTNFAREEAWDSHRRCLSTVFVVLSENRLVSYFTLSPFIVSLKIRENMPEPKKELVMELRGRLERLLGMDIKYSSVPTILLGQFCLQNEYRGRGIGGELLAKVIKPYAVLYAARIGGVGLSLHAKKQVAKRFYLNPKKNPLASGFQAVSKGSTYELFYPFAAEAIAVRRALIERFKSKEFR
ncbi:GNAT family N-acetyltransferase [Thermococcus pacificus]|uniref:hypothetical protein n=1 Tax=Thermococcus pacificus TaxID=71998 RepID=UPI001E291175|nr:hypothetical protein [Thermococcus pacificus]